MWLRVALTSEHFCYTDESDLKPGHHTSKRREIRVSFRLGRNVSTCLASIFLASFISQWWMWPNFNPRLSRQKQRGFKFGESQGVKLDVAWEQD